MEVASPGLAVPEPSRMPVLAIVAAITVCRRQREG